MELKPLLAEGVVISGQPWEMTDEDTGEVSRGVHLKTTGGIVKANGIPEEVSKLLSAGMLVRIRFALETTKTPGLFKAGDVQFLEVVGMIEKEVKTDLKAFADSISKTVGKGNSNAKAG